MRRTTLFLILLAALRAAAQTEPELDDPAARLRATREWRGDDLAGRWQTLAEAAKERDRYAIGQSNASGILRQAAVAGTAFISLGPESADFEYNGGKYFETDSGRARQIVPHPIDPNILFLSTSGGGVWKTWNARATTGPILWEPLTDALGSLSVGAFAIDPANPDILFLGLGDPFDLSQPGIVRSTDGGATWSDPQLLTATYTFGTVTYTPTAGAVTDVKVDPRNSLIVLVTTDVGYFRSTDGGQSFKHIPVQTADNGFFYMWSLAWAGNDVWLMTGQAAVVTDLPSPDNGGTLALWRSTDDGATWTSMAPALPNNAAASAGRGTLAAAPSTLLEPASSRIYLLAGTAAGSAQFDLMRSDDAGKTFYSLSVNSSRAPTNPNRDQADLNVLQGQAWYNQALLVDPQDPDTVFIGGQLAMIRSSDAGSTWSILSDWLPAVQGIDRPYVHADFHAFGVGADGTFYAGSDGGIFVSSNARSAAPASVTFTSAGNKGIVTHMIYNVACAGDHPSWANAQGWVAGGMQDNGTRVRSGNSSTFNQVQGGDGIGVAVSEGAHPDPALGTVPDVFFASAAGNIFRSTDGGQNWVHFQGGLGTAQLPFFVRFARDVAAGDTYLTFTAAPAGMYKSVAGGNWQNVSGILHWQDSNADTQGFTTPLKQVIGLRAVTTHPAVAGLWGAVSNKFAYVTADGGAHWLVSFQPKPAPGGPGIFLLTSIAFDPADGTGRSYFITSKATALVDDNGNPFPLPANFGHLYKTVDGGATWASVGTQPLSAGGLPNVGFDVVRFDPGDANTMYVGTEIGLYKSVDRGATWGRFGAGTLPLVEVTDLCISPLSRRLTAATFGRGFWQIGADASVSPAGVRGRGDTNFDGRIDGQDLIDLADAFGSTQASPTYRWQADLVGTSNGIDAADLSALLAKFGGSP